MNARRMAACIICSFVFTQLVFAAALPRKDLGQALLDASGFRGGICIELGCRDDALLSSLAENERVIAQGILSDTAKLESLRASLKKKNSYGRITVIQGSLTYLPYGNDLINLIIVENTTLLDSAPLTTDAFRVLRPRGCLMVRIKASKPKDIEAKLEKAGFTSIESLIVPSGWLKATKPKDTETDTWQQYRYKSDGIMVSQDKRIGPPQSTQWIDGPTRSRLHSQPPLGVVSAGGRFFYAYDLAPRYIDAPNKPYIVCRDAYNGTILWQRPILTEKYGDNALKNKKGFGNVRVRFNPLFVATETRLYAKLENRGPYTELDAKTGKTIATFAQKSPQGIVFHDNTLIMFGSTLQRVDAATRETLWTADVAAREVVVGSGKVFFHNRGTFGAVNLETGKEQWRRGPDAWNFDPDGPSKKRQQLVFYADDNLVFSCRDGNHVFSAKDGAYRWSHVYMIPGHGGRSSNIFKLGNLYWVHHGYRMDHKDWLKGWFGLDPATGEVKDEFLYPTNRSEQPRQKCHPDRATGRYLITGMMDFIDWKAKKYLRSRITRSTCGFGLLPANGMLYTFPTDCIAARCLLTTRGITALSSRPSIPPEAAKQDGERLVRGPAYGKPASEDKEPAWPCFRHDLKRSSATKSTIPDKPQKRWSTPVGGKLSSLTAADEKIFVTVKNLHEVLALNAADGKVLWRIPAEGRVLFPPTYYKGYCLFGDMAGYVYCVRADSGALVWRFRAAPFERLIPAFGQLESVWPAAAGVAVDQDIACVVAGRTSAIGMGLSVLGLNPETGEKRWEAKPLNPAVADLLVKLGDYLYLGYNNQFNPSSGKSTARGWATPKYYMVKGSTFLDNVYAGRTRMSVNGSVGQILVSDDKHTYGIIVLDYKRHNKYTWSTKPEHGDYKLFANAWTEYADGSRTKAKAKRKWIKTVPTRMRAMVLAGDKVAVAGPPDSWKPEGGELRIFDTADGKELCSMALVSPPVYDSLIAAYGRLYLSLQNGSVMCIGDVR